MFDLRLSQGIQIEVRPPRNIPGGIVQRDLLVRVFVEHIHVEGHAVVEEAEAPAHRGALAGYRVPGQPHPRGHAKRPGDLLRFHARPQIQAEPRGDNPVILREEVQLDVGDFKLAFAGEADAPRELPGSIENIHGVLGDLPVFFAGCHVQPDLEVMRPETVQRREAEHAEPRQANGGALLLGKIVPRVPAGRDLQVRIAPPPHPDVEAGRRKCALQ